MAKPLHDLNAHDKLYVVAIKHRRLMNAYDVSRFYCEKYLLDDVHVTRNATHAKVVSPSMLSAFFYFSSQDDASRFYEQIIKDNMGHLHPAYIITTVRQIFLPFMRYEDSACALFLGHLTTPSLP